mmetsp:Transcript_51996/g.135769  ORF Transcript_51996/g.135769 Transcript_51996/m.135769 type:complete len:99 (+) Transcript_51996:7495-7791(+)
MTARRSEGLRTKIPLQFICGSFHPPCHTARTDAIRQCMSIVQDVRCLHMRWAAMFAQGLGCKLGISFETQAQLQIGKKDKDGPSFSSRHLEPTGEGAK